MIKYFVNNLNAISVAKQKHQVDLKVLVGKRESTGHSDEIVGTRTMLF